MLKQKIDQATFDTYPAVLQAEYERNGDSYFLLAEDAVALKSSLATEREQRTTLSTEMGRLKEELNRLKKIDPERYEKLVSAEEEAEQRKAEAAKDYEAAKQAAVTAATRPLSEKLAQMERDLGEERQYTDSTLVDAQLNAWLGEHVVPAHQRAVRALITSDYKPQVVREGKERKPVLTVDGLQVGLKEFLGKLPEQDWAKSYLLGADNGSGGGAEQNKSVNPSNGGSKRTIKASDQTGIEANMEKIASGEIVVID